MYLATTSGDTVPVGAMLRAVVGPWQGRTFRFSGVHSDGQRIHVCLMTAHPFAHARMVLHPSVFRCEMQREVGRAQHVINMAWHCWQKIDEWLLAGVFALLPLSMVDPEVGHHLRLLVERIIGAGE